MRSTVGLLVILAACSGKKSGEGEQAAPAKDAAVIRVDAEPAKPASAQGAASMACLVNRVERSRKPISLLTLDLTNAALAAAGRAFAAMPGAPRPGVLDFAKSLAYRGDLDGARALRVAGEARGERVGNDLALLLGDPSTEAPRLGDIPDLVIAGQRDRAEQALAALAGPDADPFQAAARGAALAALGKGDELAALLAAATPELAVGYALGGVEGAVIVGVDASRAVAALEPMIGVGPDFADAVLMIVLEAAVRGHGAEVAPLRRALATRVAPQHRDVLVRLWRAALLGGADQAELDEIPVPAELEREITATRAALRGSLDEALTAITAAALPPPVTTRLLAAVWGRHAEAGFDAAIDAKLTAAACTKACLIGRLPGAALEVTDAGGVVDGEVVIPAAADRPTAVAAMRASLAAACGTEREPLILALTPTAKADVAVNLAGAALEAGFSNVTIAALGADDVLAPPDQRCLAEHGDPVTDPERVVLSALVTADVLWLGQSRIDELQSLSPKDPAAVTAAVQDLGNSAFFTDRTDAEIGAAPGVPASALLALVPLCKRFPRLRFVAADALTAKPTL